MLWQPHFFLYDQAGGHIKGKKIPGSSCCVPLLKILPGLMAVEVLTAPLPRSKGDAGPGDNVPIVILLQGLLSLNGQLQKIQVACGGKKKCKWIAAGPHCGCCCFRSAIMPAMCGAAMLVRDSIAKLSPYRTPSLTSF
jgi:hypothetical protein